MTLSKKGNAFNFPNFLEKAYIAFKRKMQGLPEEKIPTYGIFIEKTSTSSEDIQRI